MSRSRSTTGYIPSTCSPTPPGGEPPREGDPDVLYFGPGIHEVSHLVVGSGTTVYVAGGAVVRGRGIIDGSRSTTHTRNLLLVKGSDVSIEGVILRDAGTWAVPVR